MIRKLLLSAFVSFAVTLPVSAETLVASWNIRNLGWGDKKDLDAVAKVISNFDLIAVQEVMDPEQLQLIEDRLEASTGESWSHMASEAIGRGSYKESYGFIWRDAEISWVDGAVVYIDDSDEFAREPMSARFITSQDYQFVLASVHAIYGETVAGRQAEAGALASYRLWLDESFPATPVYIAGDFNLPPTDPAWGDMKAVAAPLITKGATTLGKRDGSYANLYDNIWAPADIGIPLQAAGIYPFPQKLGMSHEQARERVSDHAPVWFLIDASMPLTVLKGSGAAVQARTPDAEGDSATKSATGHKPVQGNKNSKIYHLQGCPGFGKISAANLIGFSTEREAAGQGYRKARNC